MAAKLSRAEEAAYDAAMALNDKWRRDGWTTIRTRELEYLRTVEWRARAFAESVGWRVDVAVTLEKRNTPPEDCEDRHR